MSDSPANPAPADARPAYLATRGGGGWRDLYRLDPAAATTLGRSAECRVVLADERASRTHAEVFRDHDGWAVRDLGSRNGTEVNAAPVDPEEPHPLTEGDELTVGDTRLVFTRDPAAPLPDGDGLDGETRAGDRPAKLAEAEDGPKILDRRRRTRLSGEEAGGPPAGDRRVGSLYRLALALGSAADETAAGEAALDLLLDHTAADIGAVLLLADDPADPPADPDARRGATRAARRLSLVAHRARVDGPYRLVSESVSTEVLAAGEAVLAEDVAEDDRLANRDSLGRLRADSLICAPLRTVPAGGDAATGRIAGLLHLYSADPGNPLDSADLDLTLAVADQLALAVANLRDRAGLTKRTATLAEGLSKAERANASLRQTLAGSLAEAGEMVGDSEPTRTLKADVRQIAPTDATVLVRGESGVGKELVARALHRHSRRADGPLVTMNCAALSESLLESELFGHEKGAFTGATAKTVGKFEAADGGTLFLDEVGEMSPAIQAKFLRVLEGHAFERVGGRTPIRCDVRVVAATNRDLEAAVEQGTFRAGPLLPAARRRADGRTAAEPAGRCARPRGALSQGQRGAGGAAGAGILGGGGGGAAGVPLAGQRAGVEERRGAGRGPVPRRGRGAGRSAADDVHPAGRPGRRRRTGGRRRAPGGRRKSEPVRGGPAGRVSAGGDRGPGARTRFGDAHAHRLEQVAGGGDPRRRTQHAGPETQEIRRVPPRGPTPERTADGGEMDGGIGLARRR